LTPSFNFSGDKSDTPSYPIPRISQQQSSSMSTAEELKALGNKAIAAKNFDEAM
jgi:hypothetical protein